MIFKKINIDCKGVYINSMFCLGLVFKSILIPVVLVQDRI